MKKSKLEIATAGVNDKIDQYLGDFKPKEKVDVPEDDLEKLKAKLLQQLLLLSSK